MKELALPNLTPSAAAEAILHFQGYPYSLENYPMFRAIFDSPYPSVVMRAGRQVSKTVTMAARQIVSLALQPFYKTIYANSSAQQTTSFSTSKLTPFLIHSPVAHRALMLGPHRKNVVNNVFSKIFTNSSEIRLTYFTDSADRIRGASADEIYFDEVQDTLWEAMIDAKECASAAPDPRFFYAGTSKSTISALQYVYELSTQKEWIIPCRGCGKWNRPGLENIGEAGLVCKACGHALDTFEGHWHAFRPASAGPTTYDGYSIPQIIMPMHCNNPKKWAELLEKRRTYPDSKFLNEVMGLPTGEGDQLITEELLRAMCLEAMPLATERTLENSGTAAFLVGGVDWGGGSDVSRTVLSIYAVYPQSRSVTKIFGKIYDAGSPSKHVEDIAWQLRRFGAVECYCDHGMGHFASSQLGDIIPGIRVVSVMYTEQNAPYRWDERSQKFLVNRTVMIDNFILDLKQGRVKAFRWADFEPFARDLLNVREEYIGEDLGKGHRVWRHYPGKPDDSLHSMVFGWFGARVRMGELNFTVT